jgi:hypothetical protein
MPINPNIALGVQPIQQPNMLGQMGQIMAIRAAQQEMEGNENTRNYFAKPISERGDPSQLLGTKQGQAAYKALNEGQIKQLEADQKRINLVGAGAGAVLENPTMETFTTVVSDLVNRGIYTPQQRDQAFAAIGNDPSKIKAFVTPIFNQAISAEKRLSDITSRANAATAAGPGHRQATVAEQRLAMEQKENENIARLIQNRLSLQTPTSAAPVDKPNVLATQVGADTAPAQSVSTLSGGSVQQRVAVIDNLINDLMGAGAKAMPRVQALIAQKNAILNEYGSDSQTILGTNPETGKPEPYLARLNKVTNQYEPVPVNQPTLSVSAGGTNTSTSASPTAATSSFNVAKPKLTPQAEKQLQIEEDRVKGKAEVGEVIGNLASKYQNLASTGGMTSTKRGVMENIGSYLANTIAGQEIGKMTATQQQSLRNEIKSASPILLQSIKKATGMTAKEMDSNADVKRWMEAMSTTSFDVESALNILKSLNAQFGSGNEIPVAPAAAPAATNKPSGGFKYIGPVKE